MTATAASARAGRLRSGATAGVGGAAIGLAAAFVVRVATGVPSLPEVVAERITLVMPLVVFDALLGLLGPLAKPLLVVVIAVGVLIAGGVAGWLAARWLDSRRVAGIALTALVGVAAVGLAGIIGATQTPTLVGAALGAVALGVTYWRAYDPEATAPTPEADANRRHLLQWGAIGLGLIVVGGAALRWLTSSSGRPTAGRLPTRITPNDVFYLISKNLVDPVVDGSTWRLEVGGLVEEELSLTLDDVRALPAVDQVQTLECISNEVGGHLISTAEWRGVRLRELLARARPSGDAVEVKLTAADGYTESFPAELVADDRVLLAYQMNGEPLPDKHGFPLRLLLPGRYGMKGPKWLTKIELVDTPYEGYWEQRGWSKEAIIKTMSRIDAPATSAELRRAATDVVELAGIAFSGERGISRVELRIGEEDRWVQASLEPAFSELAWQFWRYDWRPEPGTYEVAVRATDGYGNLQDARVAPTLPDGASGYDGVRYTIG
ncbi:MAG: molybdopterin-dependent oxidoreductase [Candidatus Limnocylindria bacterium]